MNEAIRQVARSYLDGRKLTEGLLNHIEVAIRAFDPCLSCATHALGKMPLEVELVDAEGAVVDRLLEEQRRRVAMLSLQRSAGCRAGTRPRRSATRAAATTRSARWPRATRRASRCRASRC